MVPGIPLPSEFGRAFDVLYVSHVIEHIGMVQEQDFVKLSLKVSAVLYCWRELCSPSIFTFPSSCLRTVRSSIRQKMEMDGWSNLLNPYFLGYCRRYLLTLKLNQ